MTLPALSPVTAKPVEPVDPLFFLNATEAEWDAYLVETYGTADEMEEEDA